MKHHPNPHDKDLEPAREFVEPFYTTDAREQFYFSIAIESEEFKNAVFFRQQVGVLCRFLRTVRFSFERIAKIFGKNKNSIKYQLEKYLNGSNLNGRPHLLNSQQRIILENEIERKLIAGINPTFDYITHFVHETFGKKADQDPIRHFISYYFKEKYKSVIGIGMDANRISAPEEDFDNYYSNFERILPYIRAQFCYNVDEVGYLEREDAREVHVIVRADYTMKTCYYSIDQISKRATAIHCICTDTEFIPPTIITSRMTVELSIDTILLKKAINLFLKLMDLLILRYLEIGFLIHFYTY